VGDTVPYGRRSSGTDVVPQVNCSLWVGGVGSEVRALACAVEVVVGHGIAVANVLNLYLSYSVKSLVVAAAIV
jgi:hypothetical protein